MSYFRPSLGGLLAPVAAIALLAGTPASATHRSSAGPAGFLGEWELDLMRMPDTYGTPPRRVVYRFEDIGGGQWRMTVDVTAPDGSVRHMAVRYRRDGTMAPGEGDTSEADSAAFNAPAANVLVMCLAKDKRLGSVRIYALSADGKEMTESASNVNADGQPFVRNFHFKRVG